MILVRKIYYVPGLISAVLIPILFWYYGNQKYEEMNLSVIDIGLLSKIRQGEEITNNIYFEALRDWDYKKIEILPNTAKENSKAYVSELKDLQKRNEKEKGIEFILNDHNTYGDLVSLLNDMHVAKQEEYMLDLGVTGHLFAVHTYRPSTEECLLCNDNILISIDSGVENNWTAYFKFIEPKGYEKFTNVLTKLPQQAFLIIFGFLLFLNIAMLSIKERFQIHRSA